MKGTYGLGIDLGTTQTAAAVRDDAGRTEVVRLGGRRAEIPSLVFVRDDGGLLIGEAAERRGLAEPARLAREFKRRIGDPVPILVGGTPFSAHALMAKLLRHVLDEVTRLQDGPPAAVTLTHPANWGPYKREQFSQAVRLADAGAVELITEPEAAARQHATARRIVSGETVLVYDLGGGTFDVALLRRDGDGFALVGEPEGVEQLGGADFDEAVFGHVVAALGGAAQELDADDPAVLAALTRLRRDCVEAKEALSFDTETDIPVALPGLHTRVRLNRSELESMIAPPLADTIAATRRALRGAGAEPGQVSAILLAGGSSRIPLVAQMLSEEFGRPVVADPHPEHSIALGAAVATGTHGSPRPGDTAAAGPSVVPTPRADVTTAASVRPGVHDDTTAAASVAPGIAAAASSFPPGARDNTAANASSVPVGQGTEAIRQSAPSDPWAAPELAPEPAPTRTMPTTVEEPLRGPGTPVGFRPGAASVPGPSPVSAPMTATVPTGPAAVFPAPNGTLPFPAQPSVPQEAAHVTPYQKVGPSELEAPRKRRGRRRLAVAGAAGAVLIAATAATFVVLNQDDGRDGTVADGPTSAAPSASAGSAIPGLSTDARLLVRVDTGPMSLTDRVSTVSYFRPGVGTTRESLPGTQEGDILPRWSHDREQIALTHLNPGSTSDIILMNADGSNRRKLVGGATNGRASWSGDDQQLVFVRKVGKVNQFFTIPAAGGEPQQLTDSADPKDDPVWTSNNDAIVFWQERDGVRMIYAKHVTRRVERRITDAGMGPAVDPALDPTDHWIVYTKQIGKNDSDIYLIAKDGSSPPRRLTDSPEREMDPSFSPDGKWIAFVRGSYEKPTVVIMKADGTGETVLTGPGDREGHPCWF